MRSASLRRKGVITLPRDIRERLDPREGDSFPAAVDGGRIVLTPATLIPRDQEWCWTPEWQAKEAEADEQIARGEGTAHHSDEEFHASFEVDED